MGGALNLIWALIKLFEVYMGAYSRGALIREGRLKEAMRLFESLRYLVFYNNFFLLVKVIIDDVTKFLQISVICWNPKIRIVWVMVIVLKMPGVLS